MNINTSRQYAVEWFSNQAYELFEQYSEGKIDRINLNKLMLKLTEEAKTKEIDNIWHSIEPYVDIVYKYSKLINQKL